MLGSGCLRQWILTSEKIIISIKYMLSFTYESGKVCILNIIKTDCSRVIVIMQLHFIFCFSCHVERKKEKCLQIWAIASVGLLNGLFPSNLVIILIYSFGNFYLCSGFKIISYF